MRRFDLPFCLPLSVSSLLANMLLLIALVWLIVVLVAPKPVLPSLPAIATPISVEPRVLPDLFPLETTEDEFAVSRLQPDDPRLMNAPLTQLPFSVTGILSSSNPLKSHAILTMGTQQSMVSVNDTLQGTTAQVVRIFADRLILAHQDRYEALLMSSDTQKNAL